MSESETDPKTPAALGRELVGVLHDRDQFERAVNALLAAGFQHADLSVLSSHESIDAAGAVGERWQDAVTALVGDLKYEGPLVSAGLIALAAGPVGSVIAGLTAGGVGVAAVRELLAEVTATPHTEDFSRALAAGSIILWVAVPTSDHEARARKTLESVGAENIHLYEGGAVA